MQDSAVWCLSRHCCNSMMTSSHGNIFRVTGHLCGEFTGTGEFPTQRPVTRSFDAFFDLRLNKRLSKQSWGWWLETLSRPLWRHCNVYTPGAWVLWPEACYCADKLSVVPVTTNCVASHFSTFPEFDGSNFRASRRSSAGAYQIATKTGGNKDLGLLGFRPGLYRDPSVVLYIANELYTWNVADDCIHGSNNTRYMCQQTTGLFSDYSHFIVKMYTARLYGKVPNHKQ